MPRDSSFATVNSDSPAAAAAASAAQSRTGDCVCYAATESMLHQRRAQPAVAAVRTAGGARSALRRTRSRTRLRAWAFQRRHPPRSRAQRAFVALPARVLGTRRACGARPRAARRRPRALRVACAWLWVPRSRERGHKQKKKNMASQHCAPYPENRLLIVINRTDRNFIDIDLQRFR